MSMIPEYREHQIHSYSEDRVPNELGVDIRFYKYKDPAYYDMYGYDRPEPVLREYIAYRETPKGFWIVPSYDATPTSVNTRSKKWIRKTNPNRIQHKKLFAYPTEQDALYSYYRRKLEHIRHLEAKHSQLKRIVRNIEEDTGFFGATRPQMRTINTFYDTDIKQLKTLKPRPVQGFIEEMEFAV